MPTETAADLAGMFDQAEFAELALYTPVGGGSPIPCTVIVDRGQGRRRFQAGEREAATSERKLWARRGEVGELARSGAFAMLDPEGVPTGETFTIAGMPVLDQTGTLWSADLLIGG